MPREFSTVSTTAFVKICTVFQQMQSEMNSHTWKDSIIRTKLHSLLLIAFNNSSTNFQVLPYPHISSSFIKSFWTTPESQVRILWSCDWNLWAILTTLSFALTCITSDGRDKQNWVENQALTTLEFLERAVYLVTLSDREEKQHSGSYITGNHIVTLRGENVTTPLRVYRRTLNLINNMHQTRAACSLRVWNGTLAAHRLANPTLTRPK